MASRTRMPSRCAGVEVAAAGEQLAVPRPVHDAAARHPARADHQVGVAQRVEQRLQLLGLVGPVGVHLADHVVAAVQRRPRSPWRYAAPRPSLTVRCSTRDLRVLGGDRVGEVAGAVRGAVVDDQHVDVGLQPAQPFEEGREVEGLVVGGDHHHDPTQTRAMPEQPTEGGVRSDLRGWRGGGQDGGSWKTFGPLTPWPAARVVGVVYWSLSLPPCPPVEAAVLDPPSAMPKPSWRDGPKPHPSSMRLTFCPE